MHGLFSFTQGRKGCTEKGRRTTTMSSLDDILAGMDAWSDAKTYKKPVAKVAAKPAPKKEPEPPPQKKVLKKRKIDQFFEKIPVPESEKQKKASKLLQSLMKPQGMLKTRTKNRIVRHERFLRQRW